MHPPVRWIALVALAAATCVQAAYRDVPRQHWAFEEANWVRTTGLIPATDGDRFRGNATMSRYEMANILAGYMRTYYSKRDQIDAEIKALGRADAVRAEKLRQLDERAAKLLARLEAGEVPEQDPWSEAAAAAEALPLPPLSAPAPRATATPAAQATPPERAAGPSKIAQRMEALRAKLRSRHGGLSAAEALERVREP